MKKMRKMMALVLAVAMCFTMTFATSITSFAAANEYTITVNNTNENVSIEGKTYYAHKLFDLKYSGTNYSYTIKTDNPFYSTEGAKAVLDQYFDFADTSDTTTKTVKVKTAKQNAQKTLSDADVRALADALQPFIPATSTLSATVAEGAETATIDVGEAGYYIVTGKADPKDQKQSEEVVSAVILDNADKTATVVPKVEIPTLDKKITGEHKLDAAGKAATAQVGTDVSFEIDSKVPDLTGYTAYTFTITDTMTSGLTYKADSLELKINGGDALEAGADKDYTLTVGTPTNGFTLTIPYSTLKKYEKNQSIVVTYKATVNNGALTTDYEKNTAKLTYSNSPYTNTTNDTPDKEVYVIDVDINVDKVAGASDGNKLENAKFKVFKGSTQPADAAEAWYKWDSTNNKVTWVAKADADEFVTNNQGKFVPAVRGLEAEATGTAYGLLETAAPEGYNPLDAPVIVTLTGAYSETTTAKTATVTAQGATVTNETVTLSADPNANQPVATAQVINQSGTELPSTGGIGTKIFYALGALLVIGCGIVLIARRRMAKEQ